MNKLIICLGILLVSCESVNPIKETEQSPDVKVSHYEYKGHEYLGFRSDYYNRSGLTHDPDCKKCRENMKIWIREIIEEDHEDTISFIINPFNNKCYEPKDW